MLNLMELILKREGFFRNVLKIKTHDTIIPVGGGPVAHRHEDLYLARNIGPVRRNMILTEGGDAHSNLIRSSEEELVRAEINGFHYGKEQYRLFWSWDK